MMLMRMDSHRIRECRDLMVTVYCPDRRVLQDVSGPTLGVDTRKLVKTPRIRRRGDSRRLGVWLFFPDGRWMSKCVDCGRRRDDSKGRNKVALL